MDEILEYTNDIKYKTISYLINKLISGQIYSVHEYEGDNDLDIQVYLFYIMSMSILLNNYAFFDQKVDKLRWDNLRLFKTLKLNDVEIGDYKLESPEDREAMKFYTERRKHYLKINKNRIFRKMLSKEESYKLGYFPKLKNMIEETSNQFELNKELYKKIEDYSKLPDNVLNTIFNDEKMSIIKYFRNSSAHITSFVNDDNLICKPNDITNEEELTIEYSIDQVTEILKYYLINIKPLARRSPEALEKYQQFMRMTMMMWEILDKCIKNGKNDERFERAQDILGEIHKHNRPYMKNVDRVDLTTKAYMDSLLNVMFVQNEYKEFDVSDFDLDSIQASYSRPSEEAKKSREIQSVYNSYIRYKEDLLNYELARKNGRMPENKYEELAQKKQIEIDNTHNNLKENIKQLYEMMNIGGHRLIDAIRNAFAHGSYTYEKHDGEYYVNIDDYYAKKGSTFKCEVPFYDLIGALLNNNVVSRKYGKVQNPNNNEVSTISK